MEGAHVENKDGRPPGCPVVRGRLRRHAPALARDDGRSRRAALLDHRGARRDRAGRPDPTALAGRHDDRRGAARHPDRGRRGCALACPAARGRLSRPCREQLRTPAAGPRCRAGPPLCPHVPHDPAQHRARNHARRPQRRGAGRGRDRPRQLCRRPAPPGPRPGPVVRRQPHRLHLLGPRRRQPGIRGPHRGRRAPGPRRRE